MAKIASDLDKPDGLVVVPPGTELEVLHPLPVTRLGGVGPSTAERLHQVGVKTVADLAAKTLPDLVALAGDRKSVVEGKRVDLGGRRIIKNRNSMPALSVLSTA